MTDSEYIHKLAASGISPQILENLSSRQLNHTGNIMMIYRDGETQRTQDPAAFEISEYAKKRR